MRLSIKQRTLLAALFMVSSGPALSSNPPSPADYALELSAPTQTNPPQITIAWPLSSSAMSYSVSRKEKEDGTWGQAVRLPGTATEFADTTVVSGHAYEYHVSRSASGYQNHAYIYAGMELPATEVRGKILLLVEDTYLAPLSSELSRLEQDLVGDGWTVIRHPVPRTSVDPANTDPSTWTTRSNELARVKGLIQADYLADRTTRTVFLLGHLPVPYSGLLAPDEHLDHRGAWPADVFYADMDGIWTDSQINNTGAADPRNQNVPGDGKFDQSVIPARVALEVGRVDMARLSTLPTPEVELVRHYLDKDHFFRHKLLKPAARGLINDNFGVLPGEVPGANAWSSFTPLLGVDQVEEGRWLINLGQQDYLWAYGSGAGAYTSVTGVGSTDRFLVYDAKVVFALLFGSYFGDWDSDNNFLRAPLAGSSLCLASVWTGRPGWLFHHMALGETIGFSTRLTQNNSGVYLSNYEPSGIVFGGNSVDGFTNLVHVSLMGDPTLRSQPVAPPLSLQTAVGKEGTIDLTWAPSTDEVLGYNLYRARSAGGAYVRLNNAPITTLQFSDLNTTSERFYMVRAVRLETSPSGSYFNLSQGAFAEAALPLDSTDPNTWSGRDRRSWAFTDATGMAGATPGWDLLQINGPLKITATAFNQFTVQIISTNSSGDLAPPAHFDRNRFNSWMIVAASGGIDGFASDKFNLDTTGFTGDLGGGRFSLAQSADSTSISLLFTPNHAPAVIPTSLSRPWDVPLRVPVNEFLAQFTSDADGDDRAVLQFGTSTNGTTIRRDGDVFVFDSPNNLPETIRYWVEDVRFYRPGDTVRTAEGSITIQPSPEALAFSAYHAIEIQWQGEPGKTYQLQSRLEADVDWTNEGDPFPGTGTAKSVFERTSSTTKFYRIIVVP